MRHRTDELFFFGQINIKAYRDEL
ncbi:conserved hypothetical protein [Candidatus Nitrotoga fabula]|uniref:Uncharacterized protein n=1 Tax=Candidatus Nitrotoga fabula TaxID=2182327 RepID=A0A916FAI2_9PROT|nr:conserved hypothetical protein [Candidatus Nitrotoga fabula]